MEPVTWSVVEAGGSRCEVATIELFAARVELRAVRRPEALAADPAVLAATNGGLYHTPDRPVGWTVIGGVETRPIERGGGEGNFWLLPNGAFWIDASGPHVARTEQIAPSGAVLLATQSGPLLVEGGALHPRFQATSTSRKLRTGVGVVDADTVVLARCDDVNFHTFGVLFRDTLKAKDALFLDGTISVLFGRDHPAAPPDRRTEYATFLVVRQAP